MKNKIEPRYHNINVRKKHIQRGVDNHSHKCPVAEAIMDAVKGILSVRVTRQSVTMDLNNGYRYVYELPGVAGLAVLTVDDPAYVPGSLNPCSFQLDARLCTYAPTPVKKVAVGVTSTKPRKPRTNRVTRSSAARAGGYLTLRKMATA